MKKDGLKTFLAILAMAISILALSWRGGERLAALELTATDYRTYKATRESMSVEERDRIQRVETMVEMLVKFWGMKPPKR